MRPGLRGLLAAASLSIMSALPPLGQQRATRLHAGSGIATSAPGMKRRPRRDAARQAAAQAKRQRKDAKRARDAERAAHGQHCARWCIARGHHGK